MTDILFAALVGFILAFLLVTTSGEIGVVKEDKETGVMTVKYNDKLYRLVRLEVAE